MRALVYTDLQATEGHEKCHADPTKSLQVWRVTKFYDDLFRIYTEHGCDTLWDLGDTTDDRSAIPVPAINAVCEGLARFPKSETNIKLVGNHEQYVRNTSVNIGRMFSPYFTVVESPQAFTLDLPECRVQILACPYPENTAELNAWIQQAKRPNVRTLLLGHFQIAGCFGCSGQLMSGISLDSLSWIKLGLLGHIHRPQQLGNCYYVGSPFQQNWGEAGEEKRVAIVDGDANGFHVSWVPLTGYPEYRAVSLAEFNTQVKEGGEHRFRVVLQSQAEAADFYASPYAHLAEPQYDFTATKSANSSAAEDNVDIWTPERTLRRYLERNDPAEKGIQVPKEEMLAVGMEIFSP